MVLDMTYDDVAKFVPLQDPIEISETGVNTLGLLGFDRIVCAAEERGFSIADVPKPFTCKTGCRYIMALSYGNPRLLHAVAVDEIGTVFDPADEFSREQWSKFTPLAVLEFSRRPSSERSHSS